MTQSSVTYERDARAQPDINSPGSSLLVTFLFPNPMTPAPD